MLLLWQNNVPMSIEVSLSQCLSRAMFLTLVTPDPAPINGVTVINGTMARAFSFFVLFWSNESAAELID